MQSRAANVKMHKTTNYLVTYFTYQQI